MEKLAIRVVGSIADVDPAAWDGLDHGPSCFLRHGFLRALEESGSTDPATSKKQRSGWTGVYVLVERGKQLVGAVPAYIKPHSYGEYIFDWGWANAAARNGIEYYPKLVIAAPATPATGKRLLIAHGEERGPIVEALLAAVKTIADDAECSSIHFLFCTADEHEELAEHGFFGRTTMQFHWHNQGYGSYDDFLATMKSRKRKQLRKEHERAKAAVDGIVWKRGDELSQAELDELDRFYRNTTDNHGGRDYLRPSFFHRCAKYVPEMRMVQVTAGGKHIAGALFFETEQALYGRYWGAEPGTHVDLLHFETAYYQGIERAIEKKLPLFEAGAQGEHKLVRGFRPSPTYSAHWIRHQGLSAAIEDHCRREAEAMEAEMAEMSKYLPYRTEGGGDED
ncbi:MAG: peptidogalycan biosysnthesis protein [Kofleriaceae bacterium]